MTSIKTTINVEQQGEWVRVPHEGEVVEGTISFQLGDEYSVMIAADTYHGTQSIRVPVEDAIPFEKAA